MPKCVLNCSLTANQGKYSYDPVSKVLLWDIGRIELPKLPNIRGSVSMSLLHFWNYVNTQLALKKLLLVIKISKISRSSR